MGAPALEGARYREINTPWINYDYFLQIAAAIKNPIAASHSRFVYGNKRNETGNDEIVKCITAKVYPVDLNNTVREFVKFRSTPRAAPRFRAAPRLIFLSRACFIYL